jgi:hypothetical protein
MNAWIRDCMKLLKSKIILLFVSLILLSACDENSPIPDEKFMELYVDLLIIQDTTATANFSIDSVKTLVLERYDVSNEQYDSMIKFYNSNPEKWTTFFDSATAYVERLRIEAENQP